MQNMLLPHNLPIFQKVMNELLEKGSVLLETATGTGKSYIGASCIQGLGGQWLILVPTNTLQGVWESIGRQYSLPIQTMTYQAFTFVSEDEQEKIIPKFDGFILDEAHHIGAENWSRAVKMIREIQKPYLGLTAGSRRFSDNMDVADEYFASKVIGYSLGHAIDQKILPTFQYISALFSAPDFQPVELGHIKQATYEKLVTRLEYLVENQYSIRKILKKHLIEKNHKIMVFVECMEDMSYAQECLKDLIQEENIFYANYKQGKEANDEQILSFKECKENAAIINISILMEGFHIRGVDTVIMLRRTESPRVFFQILGRIASPENADKRLRVFDFVGNASSVKYIGNGTQNAIMQINQQITDKTR